ncbi:MAG: glycosyltransferase family 1 protein [Candidatus Cloacimonetes bacterium]|nr:glycosyltransferase family 1 protein [Candidatus Cloacimonadota bacterium]
MKILVSCLAFDEGKSGISDYIVSTTKEMLHNNQVTLLIHPSDASIFPLKSPRLNYLYVAEWLKRPVLSMLWHLYLLPVLLLLKRYDLVFLPAGNRRLLAIYPAKTVVTFHDLSQFHVPAKYDAFRMFYIKRIIPHYLKKAPKIYAISQNTKEDIVRFYHIPSAQIEVNYNGYDPDKISSEVSLPELMKRFSLHKKYLLYIARIEHPGKNHLNLLKAYELLPQEIKNNYDLVCAGGLWNGGEIVMSYAKKMADSAKIHFPGFVPNSYLGALYQNASLYVFPSFYEGFGIPLLEAFAAGIPVVCSDSSSLPEIGYPAVLTFKPDNPQSIAQAILTVLKDADLQADMVKKGKERLLSFSWRKHTQTILDTWK